MGQPLGLPLLNPSRELSDSANVMEDDPVLWQPMTRRDLLRLEPLVLDDRVALQKWTLLADSLVSSPSDVRLIISKINKHDYSGAVLETLKIWQAERPGWCTVSTFLALLKKHNLNDLADRVHTLFTTPEPEPPAPIRRVVTSHDGPSSSSSSLAHTQAVQQPRGARGGQVAPAPDTDLESRITSALPDIINNVGNLSQILALLFDKNTITVSELVLVRSKPSTSEQLSALTLLFIRKPPSKWERFKEVLDITGNQDVAGRI